MNSSATTGTLNNYFLDKTTMNSLARYNLCDLQETLLKSNGPNSISKDALRDGGCPLLINCTIQKYFVNVILYRKKMGATKSIIVFQYLA